MLQKSLDLMEDLHDLALSLAMACDSVGLNNSVYFRDSGRD